MLGAIVRPSPTIRSAVIIAAAVALILPLPARCASCSAGATDCSRCQAAKAIAPAHRSCCERHPATSRNAASLADCSNHVQSKTCGCKMQVPDRTYVAADRQIIAFDLIATLPAAQPLLTVDAGQFNRLAAASDNLPPPVPHRILHCSWII